MLIFFYDMSDQTEIALDQNMTGLIVTVCTASQKLGGGGKDFNTITSK